MELFGKPKLDNTKTSTLHGGKISQTPTASSTRPFGGVEVPLKPQGGLFGNKDHPVQKQKSRDHALQPQDEESKHKEKKNPPVTSIFPPKS